MISLNINGILFNINCLEEKEIKEYFNEFIVNSTDQIIDSITIDFINDNKILEQNINTFNYNNAMKHNSFINQIHYQNDNKYVVDNKEYMCLKNNDNSYIIIGNGTKKGYNWLIRIIRELLIRKLEDNNYCFMHSTGLEIDNKGLLLLGNSGSGKTTLGLKLIETGNDVSLISNDRVFLNNNLFKYFPLALRLTVETIRNNSKLNNYFITNKVLENRKNINYSQASNTKKCDLPNTDLPNIFDLNIKSKTNNYSFIFPKKGNVLKLNNMTKDEIIKELDICNFTPNDTECLRKPWILMRTKSLKDIEIDKNKMYKYLLNNYNFYTLYSRVDNSGLEIRKELVKNHVI